jgi:two-component system LytT family response regulator
LDKWAILSGNGNDTTGNQQLDALVKMFSQQSQRYPSYFLIPVKDKLVPLAVNEIACFYLEDKVSRALTYPGKTVVIGKPLDVIAEQLDPGLFFRANRQFVVAHKAIEGITVWFGGKLRLTLSVPVPEEITISKSRVPEFKEWYMQ